MNRRLSILFVCVAIMFVQNSFAQSLSDLFNSLSGMFGSSTPQQEVVEKPTYPTDKEIIGTWVYSQPEIVYEGEDALAAMAISAIKGQLPALLQKYGFVSGSNYAIVKGSKILAVSNDKKAKATYIYDASVGKAVITGEHNGEPISVNGYLTINKNVITLLFDAQELIALASKSQQFKENTALQMAADIIASYPGVKVGVTANRR